jgi:cell wall-associated NlpC family hydrolase
MAHEPESYVQFPTDIILPLLMEGKIAALVHSHPDGPNYPSVQDMASQIQTDVPWIIVSTNGQACLPPFAWGDQLERLPLMQRGFQHGVSDCYSLIRDWYFLNRGIDLPDFPRSWEWWNNQQNLYIAGFAKAGFVPTSKEALKEGDGILFTVRSPTPNHAAIYIGNDLIIHHATARLGDDPSRLPSIEPAARWMQYATHLLTYQG